MRRYIIYPIVTLVFLGLTVNADDFEWSLQTSNTNQTLTSIMFINNSMGWVTGRGGTILSTQDGGETWRSEDSGVSGAIDDIHFTDAKFGWAVGVGGTLLRSTDGGQEWVDEDLDITSRLSGITFPTPSSGWIVGNNGVILHTSDTGQNWTGQESGTDEQLFGVHFLNDEVGWVVGHDGTILHTSDGGEEWEAQSSGINARLYAVTFVGADSGWAVGESGTILYTRDGGEQWNEYEFPHNWGFDGVFMIDHQVGWIAGQSGRLLRTANGGTSWIITQTPTNAWLLDVFFTPDGLGWAVGTGGTIIHYGPVEIDEPPFTGGDGTAQDPFQIATIEDLDAVRDYAEAHFIQISDIDLSSIENWLPIGDDDTPFSGVYHGNDFSISNMVIDREDLNEVGLFGLIAGGQIHNVFLSNVSVSGDIHVGALAGNLSDEGSIENSSVENGTVSGNERVGGLIGQSGWYDTSVRYSSAAVDVEGNKFVGGLIGWQRHTVLYRCYATGNVTGGDETGGLVGYNIQSTIEESFATGNVTGGERIGGLTGANVGFNDLVLRSYALGNVSGENYVGGLSGTHEESGIEEAEAREVFSAGEVNGNTNSGGLFGIVENNAIVVDAYWDTDGSGMEAGTGAGPTDGITGLDNAQITGANAASYLVGFDFDTTWATTASYPRLGWQDEITSVSHDHVTTASEYGLYQNYPNPFNPSTTIRFALPDAGNVELIVYDLLGRVIETLIDGYKEAGYHEVVFDAGMLSSGIYIYQIRAGEFTGMKRLVLIR